MIATIIGTLEVLAIALASGLIIGGFIGVWEYLESIR